MDMPDMPKEKELHNLKEACKDAIQAIITECAAILNADDDSINHPLPELANCGEPLIQLLLRQARQILALYRSPVSVKAPPLPLPPPLLLKRIEDLLSTSYSKFYAFPYKDVPPCWRRLYTDASILKFCHILFWPPSHSFLDTLIRTLDLSIILAGAAAKRPWIDRALSLLESAFPQTVPSLPPFSTREPFTPPVLRPISRFPSQSFTDFQAYLSARKPGGPRPLIFTDLVSSWPALTTSPWSSPSYLLSRTFGGRRLVPVEIGRSYVDEGWSQSLIQFNEFLSAYIIGIPSRDVTPHSPAPSGPSSSLSSSSPPRPSPSHNAPPTGYLAQHPLFSHIPTLHSDILTPDLCYTSPPRLPPPHSSSSSPPCLPDLYAPTAVPELDSPQLNAWFGPPGTITPLHTDPYHNLLVQVVGRKYVRLYPPWIDSRVIRKRGKENGVEMGNTSEWDLGALEGWDPPGPEAEEAEEEEGEEEKEANEFKMVSEWVDCILEPGETLYIPVGWWHYVRGLSVSFSVSFWWN